MRMVKGQEGVWLNLRTEGRAGMEVVEVVVDIMEVGRIGRVEEMG